MNSFIRTRRYVLLPHGNILLLNRYSIPASYPIRLEPEHSWSSRAYQNKAALLPSTLEPVLICTYGEDTLMKNVELTVDGTMLTITVDLSKDFGPSSSGKTTIIASTEGNVSIPDREEKIGLNIYKKKA